MVKPGYIGPKRETSNSINSDLQKIKNQIDTVFKYYEVIEQYPTPAEVTAKFKEIPPNVVMKWTGHNDYKAMRPYIDIVDSIKAESMTKFNGLI